MELKRRGDFLAGLVWDRYLDRLSRGLATVVNTLDPDVLVMAGACPTSTNSTPTCPSGLAKRIFSTVFNTPIRRAKHGDSSGVRGAAWLWA